jgi:hypothetical protein
MHASPAVPPVCCASSLGFIRPILDQIQRHLLPTAFITPPDRPAAKEPRSQEPPSQLCLISLHRTTPVTPTSALLPGTMARGRRGEIQVFTLGLRCRNLAVK